MIEKDKEKEKEKSESMVEMTLNLKDRKESARELMFYHPENQHSGPDFMALGQAGQAYKYDFSKLRTKVLPPFKS